MFPVCVFRTVAIAILVTGAVAVRPALAANQAIPCPRAATAVTVDGQLGEWPPLAQIAIAAEADWHPAAAQYADYGGPEDASAQIWLMWDNQAINLALEVSDDKLVRVGSAAEIDRGDSVVLAIASEGSAEVSQFVVALLKGTASLVWRAQPAARAGESSGIARAIWARPTPAGGATVTYEIAIPWSELSPLRPVPGEKFTAAISVCDDDGSGMEGCLERQVAITLSAEAAGAPAAAARPRTLAPRFLRPEVARFDRQSFFFQNQPALPFGARVNYAHLPRAAWGDLTEALKSAGFNSVQAAVPWFHHQPAAGDRIELNDLRDFLETCQRAGLWVQLSLGPYPDDGWQAGGAPGWVVARPPAERERLASAWYRALLPLVKRYQLTEGGPIASVVIRPSPDRAGAVSAESLQPLLELATAAGVQTPLLTANSVVARENTRQSLANLLDSLAFYAPVSAADMWTAVSKLGREENGPAVISALPGDYCSREASRASAALARIALAAGAKGVMLSDLMPGPASEIAFAPGSGAAGRAANLLGLPTMGCGELRLLGQFVRMFAADLVRAVEVKDAVKVDDPAVSSAVRLGENAGFIFLWDSKGGAHRQVRLIYTPPGTAGVMRIPEAGAIALPPGGAKVVALDLPVGRGTLRYSTSEIAGVHRLGDRTLLVVYGDADTPGEIALRWPGPPLVVGAVTRQRWEGEKSTLILDYFHSRQDQYLLVDDLEIAILCREHAATAAQIAGEPGAVTMSGGAMVASGALTPAALEAALDCPAGVAQVSVALPQPPTAVLVDGKAAPFEYASPTRVLTFAIKTETFEQEDRVSGLAQLGRAIVGGPPKLTADFNRGWFMPDSAALAALVRPATSPGGLADALNLNAGRFLRLRAQFQAAAPAGLSIAGLPDPSLVFVNGRFVPELSGAAAERAADISALLKPEGNQLEILVDVLPLPAGFAGLHAPRQGPEVTLTGPQGPSAIANWEVAVSLAGEEAGWAQPDLDMKQWHYLRFGAWRAQGRELADVLGVGWYRIPFALPRPGAWRTSYYLDVAIRGSAVLYLNGVRLARCPGSGAYRFPLPTPPLEQGGENVLAVAVYGTEPDTGLYSLTVSADREHMTRRRNVTVRY